MSTLKYEIDGDASPNDETKNFGGVIYGEVVYHHQMGKLSWQASDFACLGHSFIIDHPTDFNAIDDGQKFLEKVRAKESQTLNEAVLMFLYHNPRLVQENLRESYIIAWGTIRLWGGCYTVLGLTVGQDEQPTLFYRHVAIGGTMACPHGI